MGETQTRPTGGRRGPMQRRAKAIDLLALVVPIREAPVERLMTFEELQQKIGAKPKKDKLGGLISMSSRYKALGQKLEQVRTQVHSLTVGDLDSDTKRTQVATDIGRQLDEIKTAGESYRKKHTGKKGAVVKTLLEDVERFRGELPALLLRLGDTGPKAWPKDLALDSAMAAERLKIKSDDLVGIPAKYCRFDEFNDSAETEPAKVLGQGAMNKPELVVYGKTKLVFKKEMKVDSSRASTPTYMGIDKANPRYGQRNVASSLVGNLLGTSVMPETNFAVHKGEIGFTMGLAPGVESADLQKKMREDFASPEAFKASLGPRALADMQRKLIELEVCDILTGQADRHDGNYLIDVQGDKVTVTGIDNDLAYGKTQDSKADDVPRFTFGFNSIRTMPKLMAREIADRILGIDFDRDVMPQYKSIGLSDEEIGGARLRHEALVNHVGKLDTGGFIVSDWVRWRSKEGQTVDEYLMAGDEKNAAGLKGSLYSRMFRPFSQK